MKQTAFTIFIVFSCIISGLAQVNVSAALDSSKMLIGDQTDLHLNVNQPLGVHVIYPTLSEANLGGFEIIELGVIDTLKREPELITQQNITIAAFDSGYYQVPPLPFTAQVNGRKDTIYSAPAMMIVNTIEVDTAFIAPIKTIEEQSYTKEEIQHYVMIGLGALVLIALILFFATRKRKVEEVEEVVVKIPPHVTAMEKLKALKDAKLWQKEKLKNYYSELTFIIREYLEGRYEIKALESTTSEIFHDMKEKNLSPEQKQKLREVLQSADLVKFAKFKPTADIHENAMNVAEEFVQKTRIRVDLTGKEDENA